MGNEKISGNEPNNPNEVRLTLPPPPQKPKEVYVWGLKKSFIIQISLYIFALLFGFVMAYGPIYYKVASGFERLDTLEGDMRVVKRAVVKLCEHSEMEIPDSLITLNVDEGAKAKDVVASRSLIPSEEDLALEKK